MLSHNDLLSRLMAPRKGLHLRSALAGSFLSDYSGHFSSDGASQREDLGYGPV